MDTRFVLKKCVIAIGLAAHTFVIAELCVRAMNPQALMPRYITATPWGVRGNIPGATYRHRTPEVNVQYRINAQGMRADGDVSFDKPSGMCRVAMFGDSFFMGYELDLKDTVANQLELQLRQKGYRAEVLNFAVSGFGTGEMLRTYEAYATKFDPNLIVFQWHVSDLDDNIRSGLFTLNDSGIARAGQQYLPSVAIQDALMKSRVYRLVADNSHFYSWVRERAALMVKQLLLRLKEAQPISSAQASKNYATETPDIEAKAVAYPATLSAELLRSAKQEVAAAGRSFLVVDIPDPLSRIEFKSVWDQLPPQVVDGVDVIHADAIFKPIASPDTKLYYELGHGHITPPAAKALASAIASRIDEGRSLDGCRTSH